jgi:hypothetical protein
VPVEFEETVLNEVETGSEEFRAVIERRRGTRSAGSKALDSKSGESADPGALTRSQIGIPTRVPETGSRERKRAHGESDGRPKPFAEKLQMQKAVREANDLAASLRTQVSAVQTQLKTAQEALEHQKDTGMQEAARMAVRVSLLEEELAIVSMQAVRDRGRLSRERNLWRAWASLAMALGVVGLVLWWMMPAASGANSAAVTAAIARNNQLSPDGQGLPGSDQLTDKKAGRQSRSRDNDLPDDPPAALNMGLERFNAAVEDFPGSSLEEALRKASGDDCAIVWSNNKPSVLFPGNRPAELKEPVRHNALANTLADCADAVSRLY